MNRYISLLRGINVGGHRKILMADLRNLLLDNDCRNVQTYIQSGNIICDYDGSAQSLRKLISTLIKENYGYDVPVITTTNDSLIEASQNNPFLSDKPEIDRLYLTFLEKKPKKEDMIKLLEIEISGDKFEVFNNYIFIQYESRYSNSKLTNDFFEKNLKMTATTRNWKTVMKLLEMSKG